MPEVKAQTARRDADSLAFDEAIRENKKITFPLQESSKSRLAGKLRYWWCWFVAGSLLLIIGPPSLVILGIINK
ncbi:MAG TPA: hypothetical protein PKE66_15835, partial [Pyrinomonadaceae bacterium]|nr:hypothetical protein [Pyrinomonadaceae bacterium]